MVTTITLNPAVDKVYHVSALRQGAVMRVRDAHFTAGGKGLNVARVLHLLGADVVATGLLGGFTGGLIEQLLAADGVPNNFIRVDGESRTCINVIDDAGSSSELLEPGPTVTAAELDRFLRHFRALARHCDVIALSGSLPSGCDAAFYAELIAIAKSFGARTVLDASGDALRLGIAARPDVIKPNRDEIASLIGAPVESADAAAQAARQLCEQGVSWVVVSLGAEGAIAASRDGCYRAVAPHVEVANAVGCGDSMVASLTASLSERMPLPMALERAVAVSAASATASRTGWFEQAALESLHGRVSVTALS